MQFPYSGIMHDPIMFPSPDEFIPDRFLPSSDLYNPQLQPFDLPFGFGRRICPGMHLARNSLFVNIARILWAFDILPIKDENGKEILPDPLNYTNGFNSRPVSFQCNFVVRSEKVADLIRREGDLALDTLRKWM